MKTWRLKPLLVVIVFIDNLQEFNYLFKKQLEQERNQRIKQYQKQLQEGKIDKEKYKRDLILEGVYFERGG